MNPSVRLTISVVMGGVGVALGAIMALLHVWWYHLGPTQTRLAFLGGTVVFGILFGLLTWSGLGHE